MSVSAAAGETAGDGTRFVAFNLANVIHTLPAEAVREVLAMVIITPLPDTPAWLTGVINRRGTIIPAIDLRIRIGVTAGELELSTPILVVERMLEKSIIEGGWVHVKVAADGLEAWKSLGSESVDLIVSDVDMPNMDGLALTSRVRSDARTKGIPVVIVTSLDASDDHTRAMDVGTDAYIVKSSLSQERLLETVGRLV